MICNLPTHEQERLYNAIASKVTGGIFTRSSDVIVSLRDVYPDDNQFRAAFSVKEMRTTSARNKKVVRYILFEIERQRAGQDFDFESATYNLEHILPENPSDAWSHIEEAKQARLIYRIGNMTPLETAWNRDMGNRDYLYKRSIYADSTFRITRAVAEHYDTWDEQKIESRQHQLSRVAAGIWRVDF